MTTTLLIPSKISDQLKQKARKLKRSTKISHTQALDVVARDAKLQNWHEVSKGVKLSEPTELAFKSGCVFAMEIKESMDLNSSTDSFIEDNNAMLLCAQDIYDYFSDGSEDETWDKEEFFSSELASYAFFRMTTPSIITSIDKVLSLVAEQSFWNPRFIWSKGIFHAI